MIKLLAFASLLVLLLSIFIGMNFNLVPLTKALRSSIETLMKRMYTDNPANETLQIASYPTINQDINGAVHFLSEVVNKGSEPARFVEIIATFYDSQNRVIGTTNTSTNPQTIPPGQSAPFDLAVGYGDNISPIDIDHVKFHLDWRDSSHPF